MRYFVETEADAYDAAICRIGNDHAQAVVWQQVWGANNGYVHFIIGSRVFSDAQFEAQALTSSLQQLVSSLASTPYLFLRISDPQIHLTRPGAQDLILSTSVSIAPRKLRLYLLCWSWGVRIEGLD